MQDEHRQAGDHATRKGHGEDDTGPTAGLTRVDPGIDRLAAEAEKHRRRLRTALAATRRRRDRP